MGARWAWTAVCPNLHIYSNFSGGADDCYECGEEPEIEFNDDNATLDVQTYVERRKAGESPQDIMNSEEIESLKLLAEKHGYKVTKND